MDIKNNPGFDPQEIAELKEECQAEGMSFVYVEDEEVEMLETGECEHVQFVGTYQGKEVIYDALIYTLRLHHSSLVYEMAIEELKKSYPNYVPVEERNASYKITAEEEEDAETALTEIIEELEETEAVKVQEYVEVDTDFEYGISLDVCLNVEEIDEDVIDNFIKNFNSNTLTLDQTMYSFSDNGQE
ncbi:hypothetical protein [Arsenicibacter rosenii]|uniref:Uncharacterized protein n=1 Tax=Arsenicibacter rosenii TaxID=1750698 RepID=A0A1S2VF08_9BACT|nr:hypothetical protein [Arsenicibacter rosenii]OIN57341.1 hypothetical protein BLX24_20405 [Arsenicibacter rosenii]